MAKLKIILRRTRSLLWTAFSIIVILAAVIVGAGKLMMPYSERYQPELEAWLSQEFGQPVEIESFGGDWGAFGPSLQLRGMRLLPVNTAGQEETQADAVIESAALDIKPWNALIPGFPLYNFRVIGAHLELVRNRQGEYHLSGFGVSNRGGAESTALGDLARVGEVVLQDSELLYIDERFDLRLGITNLNGRLMLEGNEFSAEANARLFDSRSELHFGDIEGTLLLSLDESQKMQEASWQGSIRKVMLAAFQGKVPSTPFLPLTGLVDSDLWGEWSREQGHRVSGMTVLTDALLSNEYQDFHLEQLDYKFQWRFKALKDWNLHLADFHFDDGVNEWTTPRLSMARNTSRNLGLWISADKLPLGVPLNLTRDVMSVYETRWPEALPGKMDGQVSELDLVLNADWGLRMVRGEIRNASVSEWSRGPGLAGLNGRVSLDEGSGAIDLDSVNLTVDWPEMFRDPLELTLPTCHIDLNLGARWQAALEHCGILNDDIEIEGEMVISSNTGKPAVDANFAVLRANIERLDPYWPEGVMPENTLAWLRRGLLEGSIDHGRFQIHGDMDNWPFRDGNGRFEAFAQISGVGIDYFEGWPRALDAEATARFIGAGMDIEGVVNDLSGITARDVRVTIDDMKAPLLDIGYSANSDLSTFLQFLQSSPLQEKIDVDLSEFLFAGPAATVGRITVPLGGRPGELEVDGSVRLQGGQFTYPEYDIQLDDINGKLAYNQRGFNGLGLETAFRGQPATMDLFADSASSEKFRADIDGHFDVRDVMPGFLLEDFRMLQKVSGSTDWSVSMVVADQQGLDTKDVALDIRSSLKGVTMDLPAPLNKSEEMEWPFRLDFPMGETDRPLDVVFENRAALRFDLTGPENTMSRALLQLGGELAELPEPGRLRLAGTGSLLDLDGWVTVVVDEMEQGAGMGGLEFESDDLRSSGILFFDRLFDDVSLQLSVVGPEFRAGFDGENIDGVIRYTSNESSGDSLSAEFERLVLGEPVSTGMEMETDPSQLPALHFYVRSLSYLGIELGETRIEAYPAAEGFHFEMVDANSPSLSVQATGDWTLAEDGHRSDFSIHMVSESLGDFLRTMDISSSLQGGQTVVNFDAWWPGAPGTFALSRLNGQVDFTAVQGNISDASAGPGRLLGLLSIQALPKRLSLDFRDVFDSGFSFDEASGTFSMENGIAQTDDLEMKSSAASISVSGRTNLADQEYDQLMTIRPGVGNTLPIIGALAAGPAGAAAGLALQGLLHKPLAEATQVRYSITGSWDDPVIEPVEVERVEDKNE